MSAAKPHSILDFSLLARVFVFVKPYRSTFYSALVLCLVLAIMSPLRGLLIQVTIDKGLKGEVGRLPFWFNQWLDAISHHNAVQFIVIISILQIVLLLIETCFRFIFSYSTAWLGQHVIKDLRVEVYRKVLSYNLKQFDTTPIGTLTTRTINDIESVNEIFSDGLIPIIADLLTIVLVLLTMFWVDWRLTLISLIPFPLMLIATYYFKENVNQSFVKVRNAISQLNAFVQEHLTGMHIVQAFAAEDRQFEHFKTINKQHRNANINAIFAYSVFFPVVEVVLAVSVGLLVWSIAGAAGMHPMDGSGIGKLTAFVLFLNQIFRPLRFIADKFNVIQMGMVSSERIFKVLDNSDVMPISPASAILIKDTDRYSIKGQIAFKNVWFAYIEQQWVLKGVDFQLEAGKTMAIVGSTGSGKTTIISLINRLYEIQKGEILIDNTAISAIAPNTLRGQIGVVLQDVFLFSGSIYDNVTLRNPSISKEQVIEAAKLIGLHDFIMQLPNGYDYNVMERGGTLSAGQRQLLSFVRCLLYNPAILILDEATSNIDTESEHLIQQAIAKLIAGRTSIIIAHRLSTIRMADTIMVLEKGEISEMGSHDRLLAAGGSYAKLHRMQFEEA